MAASNRAPSPDEIIAAFSKAAPGSAAATPATNPDDDIISAYSKPAPVPAAPSAIVVRDPETGMLMTPETTGAAGTDQSKTLNEQLNGVVAPVNDAIGRAIAPLQPGTSPLGPNATAADLPADSYAATIRGSGSVPPQDIDQSATFNALSDRRNRLISEGKDPKADPEYRGLLQQQAAGIAQNVQTAGRFIAPVGRGEGEFAGASFPPIAPGGGVAGIVSRGANRLVPDAAAPAAPAAVVEAPPNRLVQPSPAEVAPVAPTWNRLAQPAGAPAAAPVADSVAALKQRAAPAEGAPAGPLVPRDLGAAASSTADTNMSPQQISMYQASAEGRKLLEPQPIGVPDKTAYVPGVSASDAEIEQTVNEARAAKALNVAHPEISQAAKETAAANSDARAQHFAGSAGDEVSTSLLKEVQKEQMDRDYPAAFAKAGTPDIQPIAKAIEDSLTTPRGKQNTQLQGYIKPLLDRLRNADGTPKITSAEELYGFREDLNRMRSKASQADTPNLAHVSGEIGDLIAVTDKAIEAAAPGYRQYMDNYAAAQRKIDEQEILQKHEPKLFDAQNRMTYNKFQTFMRQVVDARSARGLNPYKSISDETMQQLWNIRDDLRRSASAQELARTPGSDTTQTMMDVAKHLGMGAARVGVHVGANAVAPVIGSLAVNTGEAMWSAARAAKNKRAAVAEGLRKLNPNRLVRPED